MSELDLTFVDEIVARLGRGSDAVIPILQAIQTHYRYVPREAIERVCAADRDHAGGDRGRGDVLHPVPPPPVGRHIIRVCHGTACHVKGAELIQDAFQRRLNIADGEDTDADGLFTIAKGGLPGLLHAGPGGADRRRHLRAAHAGDGRRACSTISCSSSRSRGTRPAPTAIAAGGELGEIRVGLGSCCVAQGSGQVHRAIEDVLARKRRAGRASSGSAASACATRRRWSKLIPPAAVRRGCSPRSSADDAARHRPAALQAAGHRAADRLRRGRAGSTGC